MSPTRKRIGSTTARSRRSAKPRPKARVTPAASVPPSVPAAGDDTAPLTIVGVGASAGGLEAFTALLRSLPPDPGAAIVFVQHLAPRHKSALVSLLTGQSALPVVQATEGIRVAANHVYVIPPNTQMIIADGMLHLNARPEDRSQYTPIDSFLSSLAQAAGRHAIGVVLSGTASDGALGIRDIKAAGGVTIAQAPASAKYDGMPRAAIATGAVDLVLPPSAIGPKLAELCSLASTLR